MAPHEIRSGASTPVSSISVGTVIGIAVGGSLCLGVVLILGIKYLLRSKHQRALALMEPSGPVSGPEVLESQIPDINSARLLSRRSLRSDPSGWKSLSSREDLSNIAPARSSRRLVSKRKAGLTAKESQSQPWKLPRMAPLPSTIPLKRIKASHLPAIIESPRSQIKSPELDRQQNVSEETPEPITSPSASMKTHQSPLNRHLHTSSKKPTVQIQAGSPKSSPSVAIKPEPLFSAQRNSMLGSWPSTSKADRSVSMPFITTEPSDISSIDIKTTNDRLKRHSRSTSLGNRSSGAAPNAPLPPLPVHIVPHDQCPGGLATSPPGSASSHNSANSSIFKPLANPKPQAVKDFSQRHPEMGLGAQIRQDASRDLKRSLISNSGVPKDDADINQLERPASRRDHRAPKSLRSVPSFESNGEAVSEHGAKPKSRPMVGQLRPAGSLKSVLLPAPSDKIDYAQQPLNTPRRKSSLRKVSAYGSPPERQRSQIRSNREDPEPMPSREPSYDSLKTTSVHSSNGNPFQWDNNTITNVRATKASALKRSPSAKKTHKRQNCVRISITPQIIGSPSLASLPKMANIREESSSSPSKNSEQGDTSREQENLNWIFGHRPPSSPTFAPDVQLASKLSHPLPNFEYPASPAADVNYESELDIDDQSNYHLSAAKDRDERLSASSSVFSIPAFPSPASTGYQRNAAGMTDLPRAKISPSPVSNHGSNASPMISGLTLIETEAQSQPELEWPTIDLSPSLKPKYDSYDRISPHSLKKDRVSLSPLPSNLSPSAKAESTATLSRPPFVEVLRMPLSSTINPFDNAPNFRAPLTPTKSPSSHPLGPRSAPPQKLVRSVKALRRMNSELMDNIDITRADRRYFEIGRQASPELRNPGLDRGPATPDRELGIGKENDNSQRGSMMWGESDGMSTYAKLIDDLTRMTPSPTPNRMKSKINLGDSADKRASVMSSAGGSLYDADGFYKFS